MEKLSEGYGLVEAPVWDPERGLLFSDVRFGGVFRLDRAGRVSPLFGHRRGIGGMALHAAGGVVVSGRNVSFKPFDGGPTVTLLEADPEGGNVGYNDLTVDAAGRIYVGSLGASPVFEDGREPSPGDLWRIEAEGSARRVARGIWLTNGLGLAPDGRTLYHSDTAVRTVWCYAVRGDGSLSAGTAFATPGRGAPDGLAVARDGSVWVALADGGHGVAVYEADGRERAFLEIPLPMCTSLCFGGDDLRDLYVVSGSEGAPSERAGAVFRRRVEVPGLPIPLARTALP